jgi:hypothetical protein
MACTLRVRYVYATCTLRVRLQGPGIHLAKPLFQKPTDQSTNGGASNGRAHNFVRKKRTTENGTRAKKFKINRANHYTKAATDTGMCSDLLYISFKNVFYTEIVIMLSNVDRNMFFACMT